MRRMLIVVGKAPLPGRTKTRLVPPLTADEAAALSRGFLLDAIALGLELGWEQVTLVHPLGGGGALAEIVPSRVALHEQAGQGLSEALPAAFTQHLAAGFDRVVLMSSDNPTLPIALVREACDRLDDHDVTIGPTVDGGYYLIGMHHPHVGVFEAIDWSTPRVYAQTLARAAGLGLRVHAVPEWYDVDEPVDLDRLRQDLLRAPCGVARHTRSVLDRLSRTTASTR